ncbi:DUF2065 domain-containing protein [Sinimarinibacterium thermocellulolyticum]|uniref:DUF2065 domain-containing protein n=1 Tax=Sinimarinibacterium thermocellulolyticum TaxID=3170016 RepID=A0ABV2A9X0_9GAMM
MTVDWGELIRALGLVMVIEGLMPFAMPSRWRSMLLTIAQFDSRALRLMGACSIGAGLLVLHLVQG